MEFSIEKCARHIIKSGKKQISRKNQNAQRKANLQEVWNIRSGHHQTS